MYLDLNENQVLALEFIKKELNEKGYPPTVREIRDAINIKSTSTVHVYLQKLERLGYIKRNPTIPRGIEILKRDEEIKTSHIVNLPLVGKISAGPGILAKENIEEYIPLPASLLKGSDNFVLRVKGESMINAGILNDDYVIVNKKNIASNNQIIVALINNEYATVKRFFIEDTKIRLQPENNFMDPMYFDKHEVSILGIVTGVFRTIN